MTRIADIREQISALPKDVEQAFTIINRVSKLILQGGGNDNDVVDLVIRLRGQESLYKAFSEVLGEMISGLCRQVGLIPYISNDVKSFDYGFAREIYRNPVDPSFILHAEQAKVFNRLVRGEGLALSAPTSFGKSILIDAPIAARRLSTVVVVVPTIALLDETRRRLQRKFASTHQIITLSTQNRVQEAAIYVGTQERIVERKDIENVDLLVIDKFYKLYARQNDDRSLTLNLLLAKIGLNAKQIYLSGPLIEKVEISGALAGRIAFYRSDFSPVAADLIDLTERSDSVEALIEVLSTYPDDQTLIYSGSPPRANSLGATLVFRQVHDPKPNLNSLVRWAADNFHPAWSVLRP